MTISFPPLPAVLHLGSGGSGPAVQTLLLPSPALAAAAPSDHPGAGR